MNLQRPAALAPLRAGSPNTLAQLARAAAAAAAAGDRRSPNGGRASPAVGVFKPQEGHHPSRVTSGNNSIDVRAATHLLPFTRHHKSRTLRPSHVSAECKGGMAAAEMITMHWGGAGRNGVPIVTSKGDQQPRETGSHRETAAQTCVTPVCLHQ